MAPADLPARVGRYEVIARLARGGMGELFLARAIGPGGVAKRLCIKRMLPDLMLAPRALARFSDEARTVLALQHANIVPVFDFGRDGQNLFLAMEWIDGCDLAALPGPLAPAIAAHVTLEVAKALSYAHGRRDEEGRPAGVLHSDVTPRNILLSRQGEVRLTDFGIARALGGTGALGGTPGYMAPEAVRGGLADERSDLYSLGLVFGEMLVGKRLEDPRAALAQVPGPFGPVALRLVAEDPERRFATAADLMTALAAPLAAEVVRGAEPQAALAALVAAAAPPGERAAALDAPATMAAPTLAAPEARVKRRLPRGVVVTAIGLLAAAAAALALRRPEPPTAPPPVAARPRAEPPLAAPVAPPARPAAPAPAPHVRRPAAQLKITAPGSWVALYLDGVKLGEGTGVFTIPSGRHTLRAENPPLRFSKTQVIDAAPGETVSLQFMTR